jgi:hypothetical protein
MRLFGIDFRSKLSRRNFISLSFLGMALGITDPAPKNQAKQIQSDENSFNGAQNGFCQLQLSL